MEEIQKELGIFMQKYEKATNSHNFDLVRPLISINAVYFFSDETLNGIEEIEKGFIETWGKIKNETYEITDIDWIGISDKIATCIYRYHWSGEIDGEEKSGNGRGTNVLVKMNNNWVIIHEHLSVINHLKI